MKLVSSVLKRDARKRNSHRVGNPGVHGCAFKVAVAVAVFLLTGTGASFAGYAIKTQLKTTAGAHRYTWTVHNEDQSSGLDVFVIEVPVETRVLAHTVPPPYSNPDGSAHWVLMESNEAQVDPHDGKAWLPAPPQQRKWLIWVGQQPPSVYPAGTSATFSLTTDLSVNPGVVRGVATTYTPQNDPHYYFPFNGEVIAPGSLVSKVSPPNVSIDNLRSADGSFYSVFSANLPDDSTSDQGYPAANPPSVSVGLYAGLTIDGVVGCTYGVQYSLNLNDPTAWRGLVNVTLSEPKQIWVDSEPVSDPQRYYRVVPGPISIP